MKNLLAIIITSSLSFGCAMLEGEQTTTDSGGGGTTPPPSAPVVASWTKQFGTSDNDNGYDISTDCMGNLYTTSSEGGTNFLRKYTPTGNEEWNYVITMTGELSVAVDRNCHHSGGNNDHIYVGGEIDNSGDRNWGITRFDTNGNKISLSTGGSSSYEKVTDITVDHEGSVYITGETGGVIDGVNNGGSDIFVVKIDNVTGSTQWARQFGSYGPDHGYGITVDSTNNIYVTGRDWPGNGSITTRSYDKNGVVRWSKLESNGGSVEYGTAIIAVANNIYLTGMTAGSLHGNVNAGGGNYDIFVMKYHDNTGLNSATREWTDQIGTPRVYWPNNFYGNDKGYGIAVSNDGEYIYVTGVANGDLDGNISSDDSGQSGDVFLTKYGRTGTRYWTKQIGSSKTDEAKSITIDSSENIYIIGTTYGDLDGNRNLGSDDVPDPSLPFTPMEGDVFILKFDSNGNKQ